MLHVPAWRTHRERHRRGPGKTDPGDAVSIAHFVLRAREELGPFADESEVGLRHRKAAGETSPFPTAPSENYHDVQTYDVCPGSMYDCTA